MTFDAGPERNFLPPPEGSKPRPQIWGSTLLHPPPVEESDSAYCLFHRCFGEHVLHLGGELLTHRDWGREDVIFSSPFFENVLEIFIRARCPGNWREFHTDAGHRDFAKLKSIFICRKLNRDRSSIIKNVAYPVDSGLTRFSGWT